MYLHVQYSIVDSIRQTPVVPSRPTFKEPISMAFASSVSTQKSDNIASHLFNNRRLEFAAFKFGDLAGFDQFVILHAYEKCDRTA